MFRIKKGICILLLLFIYSSASFSNEEYIDIIYPNQKEINKQRAEILALKNDTLRLQEMVDWVTFFSDGDKKKPGYLQEGIDLAKKLKRTDELGIFYSDMAWMYFYRDEKDRAIEYFKLTIQYCKDTELLVYAYGCLSNTNSWDGNHEQALDYAKKGLEVAQELENKSNIAAAYMFLGDAYIENGEKMQGKKYHAKAMSILNYERDYNSILRLVANVYSGNTEYIVPYKYFSYARIMKFQYEMASPRKRQLIVYNLVKVSQTSILTTEREDRQAIELEEQKKRMIFFIIIIVLLIAIAVLLIYQVRIKKKANEKLQQANEIKSRLFVILNHDLRQPVASLVSYLELKSATASVMSDEEVMLMEKDMAKAANQLFVNMENLLIWAKNQMQSFEPDFQTITISEVFDAVKDFFTYENRVTIQYEIQESITLKTDENYLKTIMRNLTLNAIEASLDTKEPIVWKAYKEGKKVILTINNQGKRISQEKIDLLYTENKNKISKQGAGLIIVRNLVESLKCKIEVETSDKNGTTFKLTLNEK